MHAISTRLRPLSIVPKSSNKSSHHCASRRTFPVAVASCCRLQDVPIDRICGNENRPPIARNEHPPACHSAYRGLPTKSTARCNRRRNRCDNSSQTCFSDAFSAGSDSLFILQFVQHINELKYCTAWFVAHLHERRDCKGDCTVQGLTLCECTLTLRKPQNLLPNHIHSRRDITRPGNGFCPIVRGCAFARHNAYHLIKCWFSYLAT